MENIKKSNKAAYFKTIIITDGWKAYNKISNSTPYNSYQNFLIALKGTKPIKKKLFNGFIY